MMINAAHQMAINYSMRKREREIFSTCHRVFSACLPPASHSCRVKLLNYVIKLNTPHLARANEVAFDRTKSFNNCKLLSQHFSTARKASCPLSTIEPYLHATCHMPHAWRRPCLTLPPFAAGFGISILLRRVTKYLRTLDVSSTLSSIPKPGILAHNIKRATRGERERDRERGSQGSPLKIQLKFSWTKAPAARSRLGWAIN